MVDVVMESLDLSLAFTVTEEPLKSTNELMQEYLTPQQWKKAKVAVTDFLTDRILAACEKMDLGKMIAERGVEMLHEKKGSLGMLSLLVNETTVHAFAPRISEKINTYVAENGKRQIGDALLSQIEQYSERPIHDIVALISEEQIADIIGKAYEKLISGIANQAHGLLDISATVERKVLAMSPKELEALCLQVMKKELRAVVNLGAVIGFILGILNIFI